MPKTLKPKPLSKSQVKMLERTAASTFEQCSLSPHFAARILAALEYERQMADAAEAVAIAKEDGTKTTGDNGDGQKPHLGADRCHANRDGDCGWKQCPQIRDCEPRRTGRSCPLDVPRGDD